ncbi:acyl carrier protein [Streptomyces sp. NPDC048172]|uniref:acyl carrier protein n=1 Tax=Streptomyces sp. NPDC048172 TaxID=3365505 RepID=UPI0037112137
MSELRLAELTTIMRECLGEEEDTALEGDIADVDFGDLGFDSLAVLETVSRVERELKIKVPEEELAQAQTPAAFLKVVNAYLNAAAPEANAR